MAFVKTAVLLPFVGLGAVFAHAAAEVRKEGTCSIDSGSSEGCEDEEMAMLQAPAASLRIGSAEKGSHCSPRSLIIGPIVNQSFDTYLQWNVQLMKHGAEFMELLNLTEDEEHDTLKFQNNVDFVENGKPVFGIVLVRFTTAFPLQKTDAAKLKQYLDAGGMLVVSEQTASQVNALMEDLGSSLRQKEYRGDEYPCSTPWKTPYAPAHPGSASWCSLTRGVRGLQGSNLDEVVDSQDSSWPLFTVRHNSSFVVARAEKHRSLVVIGDDEPTDDDCATDDNNNLFAFGRYTNLRFFSNLFQKRCKYVH